MRVVDWAMPITKTDVQRVLDELLENVDLDAFVARLQLLEKIGEGEADVDAGRTYSIEDVRRQARTW